MSFGKFLEESYSFVPQNEVDEVILKCGATVFGRAARPVYSRAGGDDIQFTFPTPAGKKAPRGWFKKLAAELQKKAERTNYIDDKYKQAEFVINGKRVSIGQTMTGSPGGHIRSL